MHRNVLRLKIQIFRAGLGIGLGIVVDEINHQGQKVSRHNRSKLYNVPCRQKETVALGKQAEDS